MLVLSRRIGERTQIGETVQVTVLAIQGKRVKLGFEGPTDVSVLREEAKKDTETPAATE